MTETVIATPNPSPSVLAGATGISVLVGYGLSILATKWHIPVEVLGAGLTGITTIGTSIWHRFFGPGVPVQKP